MLTSSAVILEKGLPANLDAERFVLGSILLDDSYFIQTAGALEVDDFSVEKHRRIFARMAEIHERNERIDRVTLANELMTRGQLEACDGLSYLVSLDDGLPQTFNIESYIRIVKDKAILRKIIFASQALMNRCIAGEDEPSQILAGAEETLLKLGESQVKSGLQVAACQLVRAPLFLADTAGANLMDMHARLRRLQAERRQPLGLVVVDYLQLMSGRGRFENRNQEISTISRGFKLLAKELNVPMLVLSQLSRAPETRQGDHRPQLSDLRESGSIEQDADLVAFIFREEVYRRDREDLRGLAELLVAKQRNGPVGKVDLVFLHSLTKFENRAEDLGDEPQNN